MMIARWVWCGCCAMVLAACGGSGGGGESPAPPVPLPVAQLSLLGPDYGDTLFAAECGTATGSARQARYPAAASFSRIVRTPMVMRTDGAGGLLVAQDSYLPPSGVSSGQGMYRVDAAGAKTLLNLPYTRVFDVAPDGAIWYAQGDGVFATETLSAQGTVLTIQQGYVGAPVDGALGNVPLGFVSLIAAGRDRAYVLVAGDHSLGDHTGAFQSLLAAPSNFSLRMLTRAVNANWTIQTLPMPAGLDDAYYIRGMRVDANDNLVVLANSQYKQSLGLAADGVTSNYMGEASVWSRATPGNWTRIAAKTYPSAVFLPPCCVSRVLFGQDFDDLSLGQDGRIWVGGGGFGAVDSIGADGAWNTVAQLDGHAEEQIGVEGGIEQATFQFAYQPVAVADGVLFYDSGTCQIRKLAGGQLSTFSGPVFSPQPTFAQKQLLGLAPEGRLLFAKPGDKWLASFDLATNAISTLDSHGTMTQKAGDLACISSTGIGGSFASPCRYRYADPTVTQSRMWWGLDGASPIYSAAASSALQPKSLYQWQSASVSKLLSAAVNWPGILIGDAPTGLAGGFHVIGGKAFLFGTVRTDPAIGPITYVETRLYQIDLATGQAIPLAGNTIPSATFNQQLIDLGAVATIGLSPVFVQRRSDGSYWLANAKEVWQLDATGTTRRIAGLTTTGATGIDGIGDAASFAFISRIRVLPDDRLLVVDRDAHAVRVVDAQGRTSTLVGRLNQSGLIAGPLPAGLSGPVDVVVKGNDLLISSDKLPNLVLVQGAL